MRIILRNFAEVNFKRYFYGENEQKQSGQEGPGDVDFIPTGHQKLTKRNSKAIFTFRCQCRDGDSIIIKMQIASSLINGWRRLPREDYFKGRSSEWDISRKEWE
ncbi:MAG: hypothetical protein IKV91_08160 [Bacteroidales bacterium]|nr:hypothetical protein [Bacteroidales bacterium]